MNPLVKAILDSDIPTVRQITNTDNDEYPIELAKKKGIYRIEVTIPRQIDYLNFYNQAQLQELLLNYIFELSEDYYYRNRSMSVMLQRLAIVPYSYTLLKTR